MVEFQNLFDLQIMLFLLMGLGYLLGKNGMVSSAARKSMTDLVINIILPSNIIVSFMIEMNVFILTSCFVILCVSIGIQLFSAFCSRFFYRHVTASQLPVLKYATICSNAGFMGSPLVEELYGSQGLLYASIYLIPQRIVMWSAGISCFTEAKGRDVVKKVLTHPCIIAVMIGLVLMIFQVPFPSALTKTLRSLSSCTTAVSMIIIGNILSEIDAKTIVTRLNLYYCMIRLILFPLMVLAVCWLLHIDSLVTAVSVVLSGMPAGTTTAILAAKYHGDEHFAVKCVFLSTMLSLVTIPCFCMMIEHIF